MGRNDVYVSFEPRQVVDDSILQCESSYLVYSLAYHTHTHTQAHKNTHKYKTRMLGKWHTKTGNTYTGKLMLIERKWERPRYIKKEEGDSDS